eukprot:scaffold110575_cov18-Tisochrysis_lutea.AAC.1
MKNDLPLCFFRVPQLKATVFARSLLRIAMMLQLSVRGEVSEKIGSKSVTALGWTDKKAQRT